LERNFFEAASGFVGFGFIVDACADASDCDWVAVVFALISGVGQGFSAELFLFLLLCSATTVVPSTPLLSSVLLRRRVFVFVAPALLTSSTIISLSFLAFDFFFFCCIGSDRGNTPSPVKLSMNWQIISINFLMGAGSMDEARIDFRIDCTGLLLLDAPPLVDSIISDIACDFISNSVPVE